MEFINKMRKREFTEMILKAVIALFLSIIAIILMEGMIYGILLKAERKSDKTTVTTNTSTIAYCIKEGKDNYFVLLHNPDQDDPKVKWCSNEAYRGLTKEECESLTERRGIEGPVKKVVFGAPSAFDFSITPRHYIVITIFLLAVSGFFVYKFVALNKEYKKIEAKFKETGTIEF